MWTKIKLPAKKTEPIPEGCVTLGRGFIRFNIKACKLIPDLADYPYAEFSLDSENPKLIAVTFRKEQAEDTLPTKRCVSDSRTKNIPDGVIISEREILPAVFGEEVLGDLRTKRVVTLDDQLTNTLVIHMDREWVNTKKDPEDSEANTDVVYPEAPDGDF